MYEACQRIVRILFGMENIVPYILYMKMIFLQVTTAEGIISVMSIVKRKISQNI